MLCDGWMDMIKWGIYDLVMMLVLKKVCCLVDKVNFECLLGGE